MLGINHVTSGLSVNYFFLLGWRQCLSLYHPNMCKIYLRPLRSIIGLSAYDSVLIRTIAKHRFYYLMKHTFAERWLLPFYIILNTNRNL